MILSEKRAKAFDKNALQQHALEFSQVYLKKKTQRANLPIKRYLKEGGVERSDGV